MTDYKNVLENLNKDGAKYHTYAIENKKTHAFVLKEDLTKKEMIVYNVFRMRSKES